VSWAVYQTVAGAAIPGRGRGGTVGAVGAGRSREAEADEAGAARGEGDERGRGPALLGRRRR
jgi:hypothetical protein